MNIINTMESERLDVLKTCKDNMSSSDISSVIRESLPEGERLDALKICYKKMFSWDISSVIKESNNNCFVRLTDKEVAYLRKEKDNLLCKYYIYLKYYCSLAKKAGIKQDFTAKQFLTAIGYSTKSQKQIDKISTYNNKLKEQGLIK